MSVQTKTLLLGAAAAAASKFYLQKDWKMSAIIGAAVAVAFLVVTDIPATPSAT